MSESRKSLSTRKVGILKERPFFLLFSVLSLICNSKVWKVKEKLINILFHERELATLKMLQNGDNI